MSASTFKTVFSRILVVIAVAAALAFAYLLVRIVLAPIPVPPAPTAQKAVKFDPRLDVSKHSGFARLRPLGPSDVEPLELGRANPFAPVEVILAPTSTAAMPTSTAAAATTTL